MGFRGEALASIAAIAQVELKTRRPEDQVGICLTIENNIVRSLEPVAAAEGTSISMKNLFFNVPARRNFLKSNAAELRHIIEEFNRVALSFPQIFFSLTSNKQEIFHLEAGSLKQRITQLLGNHYNSKLVNVKEDTDYLNIYGFIGKPETAKKTRGDQYFFVNNRFIKSAYLNHALHSAYHDMIASDSYPMYVLFIDLDPAQIDVNVHPTKQEIKFEDEKIVYAFIQAAVKHALAQFSITPTLDFNLDSSIQNLDAVQQPFTENKQSLTRQSPIFKTFTEANQAHKIENEIQSGYFKELQSARNLSHPGGEAQKTGFKGLMQFVREELSGQPEGEPIGSFGLLSFSDHINLVQLMKTYIVVPLVNGIILVHQQSAHERINYERLKLALIGKPVSIQRNLFPSSLELSASDAAWLNELLPELQQMGYQIEPFGHTSFVIQGIPADLPAGNDKEVLEKILEQYKHFSSELTLSKKEILIRTLAFHQALKPGIPLEPAEMKHLITQLFNCEQPNLTPSGKPTYLELKKESLENIFGR
ncbi:MAG: DNA mismatch repair endonuclease MutL [Flavisolibacter sp.]